ncbi:hypothetical protein ACEXQE_06785 [Herbiconiux sp. P17]|uniref:hypothetical protein n=1 Tax=Herbiconiux wuyangfengii TaxID=3342794 RepID=UPI0035BB8349
MPIRVDVPIADMLLDTKNARLGQEQASQQATALALASQQGRRLVKLAESIIEKGLDPAQLPVVVATADRKRRYTVIEGNRRILSLKALDTPTLVQSALQPADFKRLVALAGQFSQSPIDEVHCVLFDAGEEDLAYEWVLTRHAGAQDGAGLVEWDSNEKDRFAARHGAHGTRNYAGQVIDFLTQIDGSSTSATRIATNVQRLLKSEYVREKLGLDRVDGELVSKYPKDEVAKGLRRIAEDLRSRRIKVPDIYDDAQRRKYIDGFASTDLPNPKSRLSGSVKLTELPSGKAAPVTPKKKPRPKQKAPRTTVAASDANMNPQSPRINEIFNELVSLSAETHPNAGSVLLRVFLELTVDDYLAANNLMSEQDRRSKPLARRIKDVSDHLASVGAIDNGLKTAVHKVADSQHGFAAGVSTFNQYVHNKYVYPKPSELRTSWDELQPFLEAVWK